MRNRDRFQRYKRANGSIAYVVDTRDASGKHVRKVFDTLGDADEFYHDIRRAKQRVRGGLEVPIREVKVKDFAPKWAESRRKTGKPESSARNEEQRIRRYVVVLMGRHVLSKATTSMWEDFLDTVQERYQLAAGTRNAIRALLATMYRDAIRKHHARENPIAAIPRLPVPKTTGKTWATLDECERYLIAARRHQSTWFYPFAFLAIQTGCREGEILSFRWDTDIDLEQGLAYVFQTFDKDAGKIEERTKGRKARWVGLNPACVAVLREYRATLPPAWQASGQLAFRRADGAPQSPRRALKIHTKTCARAGVPYIRFHDLRHQFASLFAKAKGNMKALQTLMGHSTPNMTDRYTHLDVEFLRSHVGVVQFDPDRIRDAANVQVLPQKAPRLKVIEGKKR